VTVLGDRPTAIPRDTCAWLGLVAYITTAEVLLMRKSHPLMSQSFDRWLAHPVGRIGCWLVVGTTAAHLLNLLPDKVDPFHIRSVCGLGRSTTGD
jgi:hypothetical protein